MSRILLALVLVGCASDVSVIASYEEKPTRPEEDTAVDTAAPEEDSASPDDSGDPAIDTGATDGEDSGTTDTGDPVEEEPPPVDDCTETSDLIYVISRDDNMLKLFDPGTLTFSDLGRLSCGGTATPGSMAIARDGFAYIRFSDETVSVVDLDTLDCDRTAYSDRDTNFGAFGMGYATNSADTWRDTLYIANDRKLASLDTTTWAVTNIATMPSQSELTGNAEGELWAFLPLETPAELVRLDKSSGSAVETQRLTSFPDPGDIDTFAFAHWGGSAWLFVRSYGMGESTNVYQVDPSGTMTMVLEGVGFDVVGAGSSTCAPTE